MNPTKTLTIGERVYNDRRPENIKQDDEWKTLLVEGYPFLEIGRNWVYQSPMQAAYRETDITSYPFKVNYTGANAGNDEVLTGYQIARDKYAKPN